MLKNNNIIIYKQFKQHFYLKYFIYKYISIFFKNDNIAKIYLKPIQNTYLVYIFIHNLSKTYNIKKQNYFFKSLEYYLQIPVKLYFINLNYKFVELQVYKNNEKKKLLQNIILNYNKIIKNKFKTLKIFFLIFIFSLFFKNFILLLNFINLLLKKTVKHFQILKILQFFFTYYFLLDKNLQGIKLQIKGRINGSLRAKKYSFHLGNLNTQTIKKPLYFNQMQLKTNYGICGLKLWISFI